MGVFRNLIGTIENLFQLNGINGPIIKDNSGHLQVRNANDSGFARASGAAPVNDEDFVTKGFLLSSSASFMIVDRQANTSVSLPNNTTTAGYVVVTTAGSGAAIGDVLRDDGSNSGTMEILTAVEGRTIAVTDTLSGGTISLDADSIYVWDEDGSAWTKVGDIGNVSGANRQVRYELDNTASQDSTTQIPANARVSQVALEITTAYSGGATISIGNTASAALLMATSENNPQTVGSRWLLDIDADWGVSASVVRTTIAGAPAAGAGVVVVDYSIPNE